MQAALIGGGVIGGGWAARLLLNGWDVAMFDPDPAAERKLNAVLANARSSLPALYDTRLPTEGKLSWCPDLATAVAGADWIQESLPERLELKQQSYAQIQRYAPAEAIIASSTSGYTPSVLQAGATRPEQIIVAHPFNPVYLLPLVELVGSAATPPALLERAGALLRSLGMQPLLLHKEIDAHVADRLLEAVWRESLWLVKDGICTTAELDDAIRYGFGLRWAQMGLFETYRVAGGEAGMRHFLQQFGPALAWPWSRLTDVPEFTPELVELIARQSDAQSGASSIRELERQRDANLVGILRALKLSDSGAGALIKAHEQSLQAQAPLQLPLSVERAIPSSWTDYNGHMNEAYYAVAASQASDNFLAKVGCDADYVVAGNSYFTAETNIRFLKEMHAGDTLKINTLVLAAEGKKLRLQHSLLNGTDELCAQVDTLLIHVNLSSRRSSQPTPKLAAQLATYARAHAGG